jgi:hypothetical protein
MTGDKSISMLIVGAESEGIGPFWCFKIEI